MHYIQVRGNITTELVTDQHYTSDKGNKSRLWGYLLEVTKVEDIWPEPERRRKWVCYIYNIWSYTTF